jgi:pimeloyl-ACP methyl ester carboxylesterase
MWNVDRMDVETRTVEANGVAFAYLTIGEGTPLLLLHGFPDNAWTWEHQFEPLARAGYRVVAPFQRGYAPTEVPADARYDFTTLGRDAIALAEALGGGAPCFAVGHDIGALQLQAAVAEAPDAFRRPVFVAVNHSATAGGVGLVPRLAHRSFHIWLLAHEGINELVAANDDMALIDYLWDLWSPPDPDHAEQLARVKQTLSSEGSLKAAVSVYPNFVPGETTGITEAMTRPIELPSMLVYGSDDVLPPALTEGEESFHPGGLRREVVEGAVHWPHRERPEAFNRALLEWLAESGT